MKHIAIRHSLLLLFAASWSGMATGQSDVAPAPAFDNGDFVAAAELYRISSASQPEAAFELLSKPLLVWSNPERGTASGAVFLYTHQGQPRVVMCVYPNQGTLDHEFQSLASEPLEAKRNGVLYWAPRTAGVDLKPVEASSPPGNTPFLRLREMRNLSRQFEAEIVRQGGSPKPLRLLPTPVYRYPAEGLPEGIIDGAIFSFVQSTDPEVLLLLEARENASGKRQWHFGLARMSMVRLRAMLHGQEIWNVEWAAMNPAQPYYTVGGN